MKTLHYNLGGILLLCLFQLSLTAQSGPSGHDSHGYLVAFKEGTTDAEIDQFLVDYNSDKIWISPYSNVYYLEVISYPFTPPGSTNPINDINEGVQQAADDNKPKIKTIGVDYALISLDSPTTLGFECFSNSDQESASYGTVNVSILDTGLSTDGHEPSDATYAYDINAQYDYVDDDAIAEDTQGHGTHVAGIISTVSQHLANGNSKITFDIRRVFNDEGEAHLSDIIYAMDEAILAGADIINCSFAFHEDPDASETQNPLATVIEKAQADDVLVIASASNSNEDNDVSNFPAYPASFDLDNILSVASHDCNDKLSNFSSYGVTSIDIAALGENMTGPTPDDLPTKKSGTSQATAYVTGAAAMVASHMGNPDYRMIKCAILEGAEYTENLEGLVATSGMLDPQQALVELYNCQSASTISLPNSEYNSLESSFNEDVSITPNPFTDKIIVELNEDTEAMTISVTDLHGKLIYNMQNVSGTHHEITLDDVHMNGIYFVRLQYDNQLIVKRLVKL